MASRRLLAQYVAREIIAGRKSAVVPQLAAYVVEHRMQHQLDQLVGDITYELAAQGHIVAEVTSAHEIDASLRAAFEQFAKQSNASSTVELRTEIDQDLIGGFIVETPSFRFDRSTRAQLKKLKTNKA